MSRAFYLYDAFAERPGEGNPAALLPCTAFPSEPAMAAVAGELNAWTAFLVEAEEGWQVRTYSLPPVVPSPACGHALLAAAALILGRLRPGAERVTLTTPALAVTAARGAGGWFAIDLPAIACDPVSPDLLPAPVRDGLGGAIREVAKRREGYPAWILRYDSAAALSALPRAPELLRGLEALVLATAPGVEEDLASRLFQPMKSLIEDPAGGTQHALAAPFWADRLGRRALTARSCSARGGRCRLALQGARVLIEAPVAAVAEGRLTGLLG